jgi:hypothetical protein
MREAQVRKRPITCSKPGLLSQEQPGSLGGADTADNDAEGKQELRHDDGALEATQAIGFEAAGR